jgi:choline dehydrogenase-like flavoprotein
MQRRVFLKILSSGLVLGSALFFSVKGLFFKENFLAVYHQQLDEFRKADSFKDLSSRDPEITKARTELIAKHLLENSVKDIPFFPNGKAVNGKVVRRKNMDFQTWSSHPAGGCNMGESPTESVTNPLSQTHDHKNLWITGSSILPTNGCTNGTLTFVAMGLRSAEKISAFMGKN